MHRNTQARPAFYPHCERGHAMSVNDSGNHCPVCWDEDHPPAPTPVDVVLPVEWVPTETVSSDPVKPGLVHLTDTKTDPGTGAKTERLDDSEMWGLEPILPPAKAPTVPPKPPVGAPSYPPKR